MDREKRIEELQKELRDKKFKFAQDVLRAIAVIGFGVWLLLRLMGKG
jgi:flagellar biogenesis protein FliO